MSKKIISADHSGDVCILDALATKTEAMKFASDVKRIFDTAKKNNEGIFCWHQFNPDTEHEYEKPLREILRDVDYKEEFDKFLSGRINYLECWFRGLHINNEFYFKKNVDGEYQVKAHYDDGDMYGMRTSKGYDKVDRHFAKKFLVEACRPRSEIPSTVIINGKKFKG